MDAGSLERATCQKGNGKSKKGKKEEEKEEVIDAYQHTVAYHKTAKTLLLTLTQFILRILI